MFRGKIARAIKFQLKFPTPYFILFSKNIRFRIFVRAKQRQTHKRALHVLNNSDIHRIIVLTDTAKNERDRSEQIEGFFRTRYW